MIPAKPISMVLDVESFTLSRQARIGWGIGGAVVAVLIGVSLYGVFGEYGWWVIAFIGGGGVAVFVMDMNRRTVLRHTHALRNVASELDLKIGPDGHKELHPSLKRFHLASLGHNGILQNLMYGQREGTDIALFEFEYTSGGKSSFQVRQTVIWMQRRGTRLTEFSLRPEGVWNQLGGWSGHGDINFDSHPKFSRDYLLRGDDERAIRELFTDEVLNFYERHPELITEGAGNKLLFYREGVVVPPAEIRTFLNTALTVRSLFQPRDEV